MRNSNFINESIELSPEDLYKQLREYFPKERTHYGLIKRYITEKYEMYSYELQINGFREVSDMTAGYILAFREMIGLLEQCEAQLRTKLKMKGD
jgi:hypothetical protein